MKAPFPYFGGKSKVSELVWGRLGNPRNYIEPFAGSCAVLLNRTDKPGIETINDADLLVTNFWRATKYDADAVAEFADGPVNEADMHARHRWLVQSPEAVAFRLAMKTDPEYFDAKFAGWWCWGMCCWIGGGWCSDGVQWDARISLSHGQGVTNKMPTLSRKGPGLGVNNSLKHQLPHISGDSGATGRGVNASAGHRIQLADQRSRGRGVNANDSAGTCDARALWLDSWFADLRDRLRSVRVCCGHWQRVCNSPSTTTRIGTTGVFLDPPYALDIERLKQWIAHLMNPETAEQPGDPRAATNRSDGLYANDQSQDLDKLVAEVHVWCRERGEDPEMRIAVCGYEGEHDSLLDLGWDVVAWKSNGGYGNRGDNDNRTRERIWFSPACRLEETLWCKNE